MASYVLGAGKHSRKVEIYAAPILAGFVRSFLHYSAERRLKLHLHPGSARTQITVEKHQRMGSRIDYRAANAHLRQHLKHAGGCSGFTGFQVSRRHLDFEETFVIGRGPIERSERTKVADNFVAATQLSRAKAVPDGTGGSIRRRRRPG